MKKKELTEERRATVARLRRIRGSVGMTQEKFAEILNISVSAYKKLESGENQISIDSLRKLEKELRVSADYILFGRYATIDDTWKMILNCQEEDKMSLMLRLVNYFTRSDRRHYRTEEAQGVAAGAAMDILKKGRSEGL